MPDVTITQRRYTNLAVWIDTASGDVMLQQDGHYVCIDNVGVLIDLLRRYRPTHGVTAA